MRGFYVFLGVIIVSGCSHTVGSSPLPDSSQSVASSPLSTISQHDVGRSSGESPAITKFTHIKPEQFQKIVITGSGFGTMQPYNGDSAYIRIRDKTGAWDAGHTSSSEVDSVWLDVTQWSDKKIVITGFTNQYGQENWVLNEGDRIEVDVWNPQDGNGPATKDGKVK